LGFLEDALGSGGATPVAIPIGQILNHAIGKQGNPIPDSPIDLQKILGDAGKVFGNIGADDLGGLKKAFQDILNSLINTLTDPNSSAFDGVYKGLITLLAKAFAEAFEAIVDGVKGAIGVFDADAMNNIAKAVKGLYDAFSGALLIVRKVMHARPLPL
jgi:phage-related protein